ncbi:MULTISPECIES: metallophosphoesterase [Paenibacillus]|uniref:metallophosphoesterase n=1 Tax=Paenibacillus TaxID=44249 RepID=UPI00096DFD47|nr:metallophosphoesterase [Paenibacillus odorifer]OMD81174.1 hypothetical protein BSK53_19345 [Paenibacillus odorifer]
MLRVVHLSDFHFSKDSKRDFELYCIKPLIEDLARINQDKKIDLIIFSGDLIDKGGLSFGQEKIDLAFLEFEDYVIKPILEELNLSRDSFLFVPGNHDIDRKADTERMEKALNVTLTCTEDVNKYIDDDDLTDGSKRIIKFKEFEKSYYSGTRHDISNFASTFRFNFDGLRVGVSCFNSSWRCWDSDKDKGKILLGERQVENAIEKLEGLDLKLAVIHHPLDWLNQFEKKNVENLIHKYYNLMFCGHVHEGESEYKTNMFGGTLLVSVAPANWSGGIRSDDRAYSNGYAYIDYTSDKVVLTNRTYFHTKKSYGPNIALGNDEGKAIYYLPNTTVLESLNSAKEICETIRNEQFSQTSEHLLSFRTETLAPKEINKLFVLPLLTTQLSKDKQKIYTLDEICSLEHHTLLSGPKESGKTILLDKLMMEFTDNVFKYKKIPVFIDLENSSSRIETEISRFLNIKIRKVEELLNNHEIVLLIDQLSTIPKIKTKLNALNRFLEEHKSVRVIATTTSLISSDIPIEFKSYSVLSRMFSIQINLFKSKQIRELTSNWFSLNPHYNNPDSLDEIIKVFNRLDIPRTPLAVSMFLCIFEFQPGISPINNSVLLENFIEILFEKHAPKEMFSEEFNYKNKIRLVSEIAYLMYELNDQNKRINRIQLISFIQTYMINRRFDFKADEILIGLEKVGLFTEEFDKGEYYLSFRFKCYYSFFLMKNMTFRSGFKEKVFSQERYLHFMDEIDYYTGVKGDEENLLLELKDRMLEKFKGIVEAYTPLKNLDSIFLNSNNILAANLSEEFLEVIDTTKDDTEDSLDEINDTRLEMSASLQVYSEKENMELTPYQQIERSLMIVARVLKNTEETTDGNLKSSCYKELIHCSSVFISLVRLLLEDNKSQNTDVINDEVKLSEIENFLIDYLPVGLQIFLQNLVSCSKLYVVMEDDVKEKLNSPNLYSELETMISILLYSDSKSTANLKYLKEFLKLHKHKYIKENLLMKLLFNFLTKPKNSVQENEYLNMLGELASKGQSQINKGIVKSRIMNKYREDKLKRIQNNELDQDFEQ